MPTGYPREDGVHTWAKRSGVVNINRMKDVLAAVLTAECAHGQEKSIIRFIASSYRDGVRTEFDATVSAEEVGTLYKLVTEWIERWDAEVAHEKTIQTAIDLAMASP